MVTYNDNKVVTFKLDIDKIHRGPGYWKLNTSLLTIGKYRDLIKFISPRCYH